MWYAMCLLFYCTVHECVCSICYRHLVEIVTAAKCGAYYVNGIVMVAIATKYVRWSSSLSIFPGNVTLMGIHHGTPW